MTKTRGRWIGAAIGLVIVSGGALAWKRTHDRGRIAGAFVVVPPVPAGPRALTTLGGCNDTPVFVDATTIAFAHTAGGLGAVQSIAGGSIERLTAGQMPSKGRRPDEIVLVRPADDGHARIAAFDRAAKTDVEIVHGDAAVASGSDLYYAGDEHPGELRRRAADGADAMITKLPAGRTIALVAAAPGAERLALIVHDPAGTIAACVVDLSAPAPRCLVTPGLALARPAFAGRGRYLLYAAGDGIHRADVDRAADALVVPGVRASGGLALSPDEQRLIYSDCVDGRGELYAMSAPPP